MASDELLAEYLAGRLDPATRESLEEELLSDPSARAELLAQRRVSAGLHALLGDSFPLQRGIIASLNSAPEETAIARIVQATVKQGRSTQVAGTRARQHSVLWNVVDFTKKAAAVLALGATCAALLQLPRDFTPVAKVRDGVGVEWKAKASVITGTDIRRGTLELTAGIAELEFRSGARVVIESPAEVKLLNSNEMQLVSGKLAAYVPPAATGFTVQTALGDIVDVGTRFGVEVVRGKRAEVHVLEGLVKVHAGNSERAVEGNEAIALQNQPGHEIVEATFARDRFPMGGTLLDTLLAGSGFEEDSMVVIDNAPRQYGIWSGDPALVVPAIDGVEPRTGEWMLRFDIPQRGKAAAAQQWQLVDLRTVKEAARGAKAEAVLQVWFNRASTAVLNPNFTVTLAAFKGDPHQAPHFWAARQEKALAINSAYIHTDMNPATWEKAEARLQLPADADFVLVQMAANQPHGRELGGSGHYADDATLQVRIAPRAAREAVITQ